MVSLPDDDSELLRTMIGFTAGTRHTSQGNGSSNNNNNTNEDVNDQYPVTAQTQHYSRNQSQIIESGNNYMSPYNNTTNLHNRRRPTTITVSRHHIKKIKYENSVMVIVGTILIITTFILSNLIMGNSVPDTITLDSVATAKKDGIMLCPPGMDCVPSMQARKNINYYTPCENFIGFTLGHWIYEGQQNIIDVMYTETITDIQTGIHDIFHKRLSLPSSTGSLSSTIVRDLKDQFFSLSSSCIDTWYKIPLSINSKYQQDNRNIVNNNNEDLNLQLYKLNDVRLNALISMIPDMVDERELGATIGNLMKAGIPTTLLIIPITNPFDKMSSEPFILIEPIYSLYDGNINSICHPQSSEVICKIMTDDPIKCIKILELFKEYMIDFHYNNTGYLTVHNPVKGLANIIDDTDHVWPAEFVSGLLGSIDTRFFNYKIVMTKKTAKWISTSLHNAVESISLTNWRTFLIANLVADKITHEKFLNEHEYGRIVKLSRLSNTRLTEYQNLLKFVWGNRIIPHKIVNSHRPSYHHTAKSKNVDIDLQYVTDSCNFLITKYIPKFTTYVVQQIYTPTLSETSSFDSMSENIINSIKSKINSSLILSDTNKKRIIDKLSSISFKFYTDYSNTIYPIQKSNFFWESMDIRSIRYSILINQTLEKRESRDYISCSDINLGNMFFMCFDIETQKIVIHKGYYKKINLINYVDNNEDATAILYGHSGVILASFITRLVFDTYYKPKEHSQISSTPHHTGSRGIKHKTVNSGEIEYFINSIASSRVDVDFYNFTEYIFPFLSTGFEIALDSLNYITISTSDGNVTETVTPFVSKKRFIEAFFKSMFLLGVQVPVIEAMANSTTISNVIKSEYACNLESHSI